MEIKYRIPVRRGQYIPDIYPKFYNLQEKPMNVLKSMVKIVLVAGLFILVAVAGGVGALLWPDQELKPVAAIWLKPDSAAIVDAQNSFFSLFGFLSPGRAEPHAFGMARAEAWNKRTQAYRDKGVEPDASAIEQAFPSKTLPEDSGLDTVCRPAAQACVGWYVEHAAEVESLSRTYGRWLQRYLALYQKPYYHNRILPHAQVPWPAFNVASKIQALRHAQLGVAYVSGDSDTALRGVAEDLAYARGLLADSNDLVAKISALKMALNAIHLYSQFLDAPRAPPALFQEIAALAPQSAAERDMRKPFQYEYQGMATFYLGLAHQDAFAKTGLGGRSSPAATTAKPWYRNLVYKPHATIHLALPVYLLAAEYGKLSASELLEQSRVVPRTLPWWSWLYNPVGTILESNPFPDFTNYALRVQSFGGLLNLLKLKAKFRAAGGAADPEEFVQAHAIEYPGLFPEQPVQWDGQSHVLFYPVPEEAKAVLHPEYRELRLEN